MINHEHKCKQFCLICTAQHVPMCCAQYSYYVRMSKLHVPAYLQIFSTWIVLVCASAIFVAKLYSLILSGYLWLAAIICLCVNSYKILQVTLNSSTSQSKNCFEPVNQAPVMVLCNQLQVPTICLFSLTFCCKNARHNFST